MTKSLIGRKNLHTDANLCY